MLKTNLKQDALSDATQELDATTIQLNEATVFADVPSPRRRVEPRDLTPGSLINNRFQLVRKIGVGGMGVVYTARDHRKEEAGDLDSVVAIKLLSEALESSPNAMRMLQQECTKSQTLAHPNIVTVYDFDRDGSTYYMTMEYLDGITLEAFIDEKENQGRSLETVLCHIEGMANGLQYAHENGIIHSDLKPANIFITSDNEIKIFDFGIARAMSESEDELDWLWKDNENTDQDETVLIDPAEEGNELVAFTPSFASPEMFKGAAPSPGDDIYALACITYYLLTGKHPYGKVQADLAIELGLTPERIEGLNDRAWNALLQGLSLDTDLRTNSVAEFLAGFKPKKKERWKWATAGIAVALVVTMAYSFFKPPVIPDLFENPLPEKPVTAQVQQQVNDQLELAEINMLVGRLISPSGSNALDQYQQVLKLHPYDRKAIAGLSTLLDTIADQAEQSLQGGNREDAILLLQAGLGIHPKHSRLLSIQKKLKH